MLNLEEMSAAIDAVTSPTVKIWLNWMLAIFLASILFVWKHKSARVILAAFFLTIPVAMLVFETSRNPHLLGIPHLIVWTPLVVYLLRSEKLIGTGASLSIYNVYLYLLLATIITSLVLDVRDVTLVVAGLK